MPNPCKNYHIIRHETVGSTNDEARLLGEGGAACGTVVVAGEQTRGRGRRGHAWASPRGGLWMSLLVRVKEKKEKTEPGVAPLTIASGVAVAECLADIFSETGLDPARVRLGWPNDVLIEDKKIAGILCETCFSGPAKKPSIVVGIGVNINNRASLFPPPIRDTSISLIELTGVEYSLERALEKTLASLENTLEPLLLGEAERSGEILARWKERAALFGRDVRIQSPGTPPFTAVACDIDSAGRLLVKDAAGRRRAIEFDEASLIR